MNTFMTVIMILILKYQIFSDYDMDSEQESYGNEDDQEEGYFY